MNTKEVGQKLIDMCRKGLNMDAIGTLYSRDIVSVEAVGTDAFPQEIRGIEKVIDKNKRWYDNNEIHSASAEGPFPHKDRFAVIFKYESTGKSGPMKGKRMKFNEIAIYTVKDGKIVREEFFYDMG